MTIAAVRAPKPEIELWRWDDSVVVDGVSYPANWLDSPDDRWKRTVILKGTPPKYRDALLAAAQASPTPHAWRVGEPLEPHQVDQSVIERARVLFRKDEVDLASAFLTFLGELPDGTLQLFGCAAARSHVSPSYVSEAWIVLGRLLAVPELRGTGLGNHFNFHFFALSQTLCGFPALGNFMPTETEQTRRLCRKAMENGVLDMVTMGAKRWPVLDTVFEVEVYLAFYPGMREWLLEQTAALKRDRPPPPELMELLSATEGAWTKGYDHAGGVQLGKIFAPLESKLEALTGTDARFALYLDYLRSARAMGTLG